MGKLFKRKMKIAIDMDNTLIDELGSTIRPGVINFLKTLCEKHTLCLWTNSTKARAIDMLYHFNLREYFEKIIAREDYYNGEKFMPKDLRRFEFDAIIDDDPEEVAYNRNNGKLAFQVEPYRKGKPVNPDELDKIKNHLK
jgi:predicted phosphatase